MDHRSTSGPTPRDSSPMDASSTSATRRTRSARPAISRIASRTACTRCRSPTMASGCTWPEPRPAFTSSIQRRSRAAATRSSLPVRRDAISVRRSRRSNGVIDAAKLPLIANDCLHMVVNNDPGLKAFLASNASPEAKAARYLVLLTRSRFDVYPPVNASPTGTHSAVFIPNRPARVRGNTKGRPAYVWLSDENGGCPLNYARMVSVESEMTPIMVGAFAIPDNQVEECLTQATTEPNGQPRRRIPQQNHNPTIFKNLVFTTWYAPRPAGDRHLQPVHTARGWPCVDRPAGSRPHVSGLQGRPDLLGGQRHGSSRGALHRAPCGRTARPRHGNV